VQPLQHAVSVNSVLSANSDGREDYAYVLGMQAYVYGYLALHFAKVRYASLHATKDGSVMPVNYLFHKPRLSNHNDKYGGSPMRDAIYLWHGSTCRQSLSWQVLPMGRGAMLACSLRRFILTYLAILVLGLRGIAPRRAWL
jgi:hypothetical protein